MIDADVLVVGGGPVGLATAIEARLAGFSVVVAEPRRGSIDKACGEGLMPGAVPLLARLGVDPPGCPLRGVSYRDGVHRVDHVFSHGAGRGVRRIALHEALARRADELGVRREAVRVEEVEQGADDVRAGGVRARYLLACDGLHSTVARAVGLALPVPRGTRRYGIREHHEVEPWSDLIEVHVARDAEFYVTPVADDTVGISMLARQGVDYDDALASAPELEERIAGTMLVSTRRGAGPFRQRTRRRVAGRVLLVGDASGYVDAITGEGLRLGFAQATEAVAAVLAGRPRDYERRWRRVTRDFRMLTSGLVALATSPARPYVIPTASRNPALFGRMVDRLAR
ncbi:flavin-dependent dehydrogenase [Diaminobutyricimonas aerilata]|uniref:Flavin-dependent dehydrogenase n=1 Tax=Diaminobutyricimonas aerilata TaxID=1162967 RepID=A0A2M9CEY5_9MICO|nr:FAD-dependent monooxygenase [Diaminobutyricimonas aerilata]PJJ70516.1 flavin-dependent dehydrogenase [Diaminobutyricimonas aerilata]